MKIGDSWQVKEEILGHIEEFTCGLVWVGEGQEG